MNKGGGNGAEAFLDMKLNKGDAERLVIGTNNVYLLPLVAFKSGREAATQLAGKPWHFVRLAAPFMPKLGFLF